MAKKEYNTSKGAEKKSAPSKAKKKAQKIGSIPPGFNEKDILFMEDNKIFISKK